MNSIDCELTLLAPISGYAGLMLFGSVVSDVTALDSGTGMQTGGATFNVINL